MVSSHGMLGFLLSPFSRARKTEPEIQIDEPTPGEAAPNELSEEALEALEIEQAEIVGRRCMVFGDILTADMTTALDIDPKDRCRIYVLNDAPAGSGSEQAPIWKMPGSPRSVSSPMACCPPEPTASWTVETRSPSIRRLGIGFPTCTGRPWPPLNLTLKRCGASRPTCRHKGISTARFWQPECLHAD